MYVVCKCVSEVKIWFLGVQFFYLQRYFYSDINHFFVGRGRGRVVVYEEIVKIITVFSEVDRPTEASQVVGVRYRGGQGPLD